MPKTGVKEVKRMRFDSHTHTRFSFDASPEVTHEAMCDAALRAGLSGIAFTDHFDVNGEVEGIYDPFDADGAFLAASEAADRYRGRLRVSRGIELGQATEYPKEARAFLDAHPYDFVLGSVHNLPAVPDFYYLRYDDMPEALADQLFSRTLAEEMKLCDFGGIHALAHLSYMHRYLVEAGRDLDFGKHREELAALFERMIRKDLALEINVSMLRKGIDLLMPTASTVRLYRDLGGTLFTVGSDAHSPDAVGARIDDAYALLRSIGVDRIAFYENGAPMLFPI